MSLLILRKPLLWAALLAGAALSQRAAAQGCNPPVSEPPLFYNYYVRNPNCGNGAAMYPCPRPVPPQMGHTYITYQALEPHQFLYTHRRKYYRYHPGAGFTRADVAWKAPIHLTAIPGMLAATANGIASTVVSATPVWW